MPSRYPARQLRSGRTIDQNRPEQSRQVAGKNLCIGDENLPKWQSFFARHPDLFDWQTPDGSCMAFPRYKGADGGEQFTPSLVEKSGVLLLPGSINNSQLGETPSDRFWLDYGRSGLDEGLAVLDAHIMRNRR